VHVGMRLVAVVVVFKAQPGFYLVAEQEEKAFHAYAYGIKHRVGIHNRLAVISREKHRAAKVDYFGQHLPRRQGVAMAVAAAQSFHGRSL
jgi:hypothetical protein